MTPKRESKAKKDTIKPLRIDENYMLEILARLLETPSPSGMTDAIVNLVCEELSALKIPHELTRRGAIRADLPGRQHEPDRAIVAHLDTLGLIVKQLKDNGRLEVLPIGHWSARFAEGARVTVYTDSGWHVRGTVLPFKASGHVYNEEVDTQPNEWSNVEVRLDAKANSREDLVKLGLNVGDTISVDTRTEILENGFINSRHLDDKAGVAAILAAAKSVKEDGLTLPIDCHLLFTISEEVGVGASHVLHGDVAELVSVDNGTIAPGQNTSEYGATICMMDSSGPFDWHLTRHLIDICESKKIDYSRDVFRHYRSDAAAAVEAGNDIRASLVCFALDASHGFERTHVDSLNSVAQLLGSYMQSEPLFSRDKEALGPMADFPSADAQM